MISCDMPTPTCLIFPTIPIGFLRAHTLKKSSWNRNDSNNRGVCKPIFLIGSPSWVTPPPIDRQVRLEYTIMYVFACGYNLITSQSK